MAWLRGVASVLQVSLIPAAVACETPIEASFPADETADDTMISVADGTVTTDPSTSTSGSSSTTEASTSSPSESTGATGTSGGLDSGETTTGEDIVMCHCEYSQATNEYACGFGEMGKMCEVGLEPDTACDPRVVGSGCCDAMFGDVWRCVCQGQACKWKFEDCDALAECGG